MTQNAKKRIVLIGAGSMVFSAGLMRDLVLSTFLAGSTIALVDINESKLDLMARVAERMIQQEDADLHLEKATDRREVLADADYVITTISVGGQPAWQHDLKIPLKHGIVQSVGDSVGPGGISRAMRHIPLMVNIARDMAELCPNAILFNYSNPMSSICRAVTRETPIQAVGLCHGVTNTRNYLADYMDLPREELEVRVAGINHLVWMVQLLHKGRDAYPKLWDLLAEKGPEERPASFELMEIYGLFPGPGHDHIVEFYPYFLSAKADYGDKYGLGLFPIDSMNERRGARMERFRAQADGRQPIEIRPSGEDVMEIISAMITHEPKIAAVNVPNHGVVEGLPDSAIVEVSALVDGGGIQPMQAGALPAGVLRTLNGWVSQQELVVDAAVNGDRQAALQAMLADPQITSVDQAKAILDEFLAVHADLYPTF
jgi:alpha-galactosidase